MDKVDECVRECVIGELEIQVARNVLSVEEAQGDFLADAPCLQLTLKPNERVFGEEEFRRTIRRDGKETQTVSARTYIREKIDGGCIRPVNVVEEENDWRAA
jgi:hypothetical protein